MYDFNNQIYLPITKTNGLVVENVEIYGNVVWANEWCYEYGNTEAKGIYVDARNRSSSSVQGLTIHSNTVGWVGGIGIGISEDETQGGNVENVIVRNNILYNSGIEIPSDTDSDYNVFYDDPDAPPKVWEHWTVWNLPPNTKQIAENTVPNGAIQGMNDFNRVEWGGPCPPPGKVHHYNFKLYALDMVLSLDSSARKADVEEAMRGHIIEETILVGTYER